MHTHKWRKTYEEAYIGPPFPVGWECIVCGKFVSQTRLNPDGLPGEVVEGKILRPPLNRETGATGDGKLYTRQVIDEDGNLTVERPE